MQSMAVHDDLIFLDTLSFMKKVRKIKKSYCQETIDELKISLKSIEKIYVIFKKIKSFENYGLEHERNCFYQIGKENVDFYLVTLLNAKKRLTDLLKELKAKKKEK